MNIVTDLLGLYMIYYYFRLPRDSTVTDSANTIYSRRATMNNFFDDQPDEILIEIMLNLNVDSLKQFCSTNNRIRKLCKSSIFWNQYQQKYNLTEKPLFMEKYLERGEFQKLPNEIIWNIMLAMDLETLYSFCKADQRSAEVCNTLQFWKEHAQEDIDYFFNAAKFGFVKLVNLFLEGGTDPNIQDMYGNTALKIAIEHSNKTSNEDTVNELLEAGADFNLASNRGWTPLNTAALYSGENIINLLLKAGADPNQQENGITALMFAVNDVGKVKILLNAGADPNVQDNDCNTVLINAVEYSKEDIVKILLDAGANPNLKGKFGWTALMSAVEYSKEDIVKILLDAGANPNLKDKFGWTALMSAAKKSKADIIIV